jgi:hypothetical protein
MEELFAREWENLADRVSGPMWFRLVMQPVMASIFAVIDALSDAREGKPGYFWAVITRRNQRLELLNEGWSSVAKIFLMAMIIDAVYQWIVQKWIYPGEIAIVAFLLAVVPYVLIRGPVNRIVSRFGLLKPQIPKAHE